MVYAHDGDGVLQVVDGIEDSGLAILSQETSVEGYLHYASGLSQAAHLVIGEVAWMVAQTATVGVRAYYRGTACLKSVVETLLTGVTEVNHYAEAVHLAYHLLTVGRHAVVEAGTLGRVAYKVVAVMTQRHICYATLGEVPQVVDVILNGKTVLYAEYYALASLRLVSLDVGYGACLCYLTVAVSHYALYLVEYKIGVLAWGVDRVVHQFTEGLALASLRCSVVGSPGLWQVTYHGSGIKPSLTHLVQVNEYSLVAFQEVYPLMEEHRGVAM